MNIYLLFVLPEDNCMEIHSAEDIRLVPGQCVKALFRDTNDSFQSIGFFARPVEDSTDLSSLKDVLQRGGLVQFDRVLLVLTMLKLNNSDRHIFDIWWNYHAPDGPSSFEKMSQQDHLKVHLCDEHSALSEFRTTNSFKKFFASLLRLLDRSNPWTEVEFERAVAKFCAENHPKQSLWSTVERSFLNPEIETEHQLHPEGYPGFIPYDLRAFYVYTPDMGHCIKVIPSNLENEVKTADPQEFLLAAPVRSVLRCGFRWLRGFPVAPIPFIPGHGLATPPEDIEF
ncbi:MAG: hypothetical protein V1897_02065 [Pseudomonadota bacterium]